MWVKQCHKSVHQFVYRKHIASRTSLLDLDLGSTSRWALTKSVYNSSTSIRKKKMKHLHIVELTLPKTATVWHETVWLNYRSASILTVPVRLASNIVNSFPVSNQIQVVKSPSLKPHLNFLASLWKKCLLWSLPQFTIPYYLENIFYIRIMLIPSCIYIYNIHTITV